jgi:innexin
MNYLVKSINQYVDDDRRYENERNINIFKRLLMTIFPCFGRFLGNYIVILYFIVKLIYIVNTLLQVFLISSLLGKNFWYFGVDFFYNLISGQGWITASSNYFPSK